MVECRTPQLGSVHTISHNCLSSNRSDISSSFYQYSRFVSLSHLTLKVRNCPPRGNLPTPSLPYSSCYVRCSSPICKTSPRQCLRRCSCFASLVNCSQHSHDRLHWHPVCMGVSPKPSRPCEQWSYGAVGWLAPQTPTLCPAGMRAKSPSKAGGHLRRRGNRCGCRLLPVSAWRGCHSRGAFGDCMRGFRCALSPGYVIHAFFELCTEGLKCAASAAILWRLRL